MPCVIDPHISHSLCGKFCPLQDSRTPLQWAASAGHLDIVTYLLANGAEVDKLDDSGWTALHIAGALRDSSLSLAFR
jgi:ankyrin repeat protein